MHSTKRVTVSLENDNNEAITLQLTREVMHVLLQARSKTIQLQNKKSGHTLTGDEAVWSLTANRNPFAQPASGANETSFLRIHRTNTADNLVAEYLGRGNAKLRIPRSGKQPASARQTADEQAKQALERLRAALDVAPSPSDEVISTHPATFWTDADAAERATLEQRIVLVLAVHNALTLPQLAYLVGDGVAQNGRLTPEFTQALCSTCLLCSQSSSGPSDDPSRPTSANMDTFQLHPAAGVARLPSQGHPALQGPISPAQHAQLLKNTPHITPPSSFSDGSLLSWTSWLCRRKAWCVNLLSMMQEDRTSALQRRQEDWNDTALTDNPAASTRIPGITRQPSTGSTASKRGGTDALDARASRARGSTKRKQASSQPETPAAVATTATDNRSPVAATVATASDKSALASRIRMSLGTTTALSDALTTGSAALTSGKKPAHSAKSAKSMVQVAANDVRPSVTNQAAELHPFGPPPQDHASSDGVVERAQGLLQHCDVALHAPVAPLLSPLRRIVDGEARRDLLMHLHEQLVELVAEGHDKTELRCGKLVLLTSQWLHKAETVLLQVKRRLREYDGFGELTAAMVTDLF